MKKYLLVSCMAVLACTFSFAKQNKGSGQQHSAGNVLFGNDVIIDNNTGFDQSVVKITTAFNGWQYAAISYNNLLSFTAGVIVKASRDNGVTWTTIDSYTNSNVAYPALDLVVAGTDTMALTLYNAVVTQDMMSNAYNLSIHQYDARTGASQGTVYSLDSPSGLFRDVAMASDYAAPGPNASPYSVGMVYSASDPSGADTLVFVASTDGGATWGVNQTVLISTSYFRKVSLAYGFSASASNGYYYTAWESLLAPDDRTGDILSSRTDSTINGGWTNPVMLDAIDPNQTGFCRNPSIAASFGVADNDSGSVTEVVLADFDFNGDGSDYDVVGFYNSASHVTDFWNTIIVANTVENDMQADIAYCQGTTSFLCTYSDSTDAFLEYVSNNLNLTDPNTWAFVFEKYNDALTGLKNPMPQISVNPVTNTAVFAWIQNNGSKDIALFDAEGSTVSVLPVNENEALSLYPNPAIHNINVSVSLKSNSHVSVSIYNSMGQLMITEDLGTLVTGISNHMINIDGLANGNYFVKVTGDRFIKTEQLVVAKY